MRIDGQPAAVEAVLIRATEVVGRTDQSHGDSRDRGALLVLRMRRRR